MAKASIKDMKTLITYLQDLGYTNVSKITNKKVAILTEENRVDVLENVAKKSGGKFDRNPRQESSVGMVMIGTFTILAKPARKQGGGSAGLSNEQMLVDTINNLCKKGPINVVFRESPTKKYIVRGCILAKAVGRKVSNRRKADVYVIDIKGNAFPLSIKQDDAEIWESADTYYAASAMKAINEALKQQKVSMVPQSNYFTIEPNIAVKATTAETRDVVFGSDIAQQKGAIITKTFSKGSFTQSGDTVTIQVTDIITKMSDVDSDKQVYFLIRNDKTRRTIDRYPGIRVLAVYKKRINKNVVVITI
jgi:hypothetical protein